MLKRMPAPSLYAVPGLRNPKVDRNVSLPSRPKNSDLASNGMGKVQIVRGAEASPVLAKASTCNCLAHMGWIRRFAVVTTD